MPGATPRTILPIASRRLSSLRLASLHLASLHLALILALASCDGAGGGGAGGAGGGTEDTSATGGAAEEAADVAGMTAAHNAARSSVTPAADPPMAPLVWDAGLAGVAQAYAERCVFEHSGDEYGENLAAAAGQRLTPQDVVDSWVSEVAAYDHATNGCSGVCGHYTQVVWADSRRLGCGVAICTTGSPFDGFSEWQSWVCNYDPPGNWVGERPY